MLTNKRLNCNRQQSYCKRILIPKLSRQKRTFDTLKNPNENSFFIHPTTKEEIEDNIKLLNDHKTTGPYSIPTQILKQLKKFCLSP